MGGGPPIPLACKEVEDENDDEDDWGSRGLRPNIAGIVCIKAIDPIGPGFGTTRASISLKLYVNWYVNRGFLLDGFPVGFLPLP
jgi:hypothetical protein